MMNKKMTYYIIKEFSIRVIAFLFNKLPNLRFLVALAFIFLVIQITYGNCRIKI
jgi:hypothetical protein